MSDTRLSAGLGAFLAKLGAEHAARAATRSPHPATILVNREAYTYLIAALRIVSERTGVPPPQDGLYTFRGIKLRCA